MPGCRTSTKFLVPIPKNLHTYAYYITEKHQTLVLPVSTSNFTQLSKKGKIPFARGPSSPPPWMGQPPHCPYGSVYGPLSVDWFFLIHTQYMVDIQYTAGLATKETPCTQHGRAVQDGRIAGSENVANWRRGDSRTARARALLSKA